MNMRQIKFTAVVAGVLSLWLGVAGNLYAQRTGGSSGRTGGFGGGASSAGRSAGGSAAGSQSYNPNGQVGSATISVDPDTRNITVIADEETMKQISQVISNLDHPRPQVLIKVVFLEVQHNDASDIGMEGGWGPSKLTQSSTGVFANAFGLSGIATGVGSNSPLNVFGQNTSSFLPMPPGAGLYQMLGKDFQATLRAIAQAGKAQLLSRPSILARDSQPATIVVGQSVPLITSVRYDNYGNAINSVSYTDVGIILKVTPYVTPEGLVQMMVAPQTTSVDPTMTVPISVGVNAPVIDVRSADTVVVTPDGQTVVIGGLMRKDKTSTENKIPLLGDIPFFGNLFKRVIKSDIKTELLIFLTPHIVQAPAQLAAMTSRERLQTVPVDSESEKELDRFLDKTPTKPADKGSKKTAPKS